MARKLKQILISEVSLVDEPANKRKFAVVKRRLTAKGQTMDELKVLIEAFTGEKLDEEVIAKAKANEKLLGCITDHLKLIDKYRNDLPVDLISSVGYLAMQAAFSPSLNKSADTEEETTEEETTEEEATEEVEKDDTTEETVEEEEVEKDEVTEETTEDSTKEETETIDIDKFLADVISKATEAVNEVTKAMQDKIDALSAKVDEMQKALEVNKNSDPDENRQLSSEEIASLIAKRVAEAVK